MKTKLYASSRGTVHYSILNYTDQSISAEIDADKCLVNLYIALYTLFKQLNNFINSHLTDSNIFEQNPSTLIHGKSAYNSREKYLLSFDAGKTYLKHFKLEELTLYEKSSLQLGNLFESNLGI